ncbi:MAG: homoserine dehydrogenase [Rhodobiaceae bacterium]|nr:homoserine dehydrogenase [Rhodobiaceae bacterium]
MNHSKNITKNLNIGIAGLGNVGEGVINLLQKNSELIEKKLEKKIIIKGVSAKNRKKQRNYNIDTYAWYDDPIDLARSGDIDVFIELIGGEDGVALEATQAAIESGKHVITANKAMLANHGNFLIEIAEKRKTLLLFEAAVAGGIPIVKLLKESLSCNSTAKIYGILNGTCNYILSSMENNSIGFDVSLKEAQRLGYAEADPSFDVGGYDAAHKLSILSSLAFGTKIDFSSIHIEGIEKISLDDIQAAKEHGYKIRLLGISEKKTSGITQCVQPCLVSDKSLISSIDGVNNAIVVDGNFVGAITISGLGAGSKPTASSVVADIFDIANKSTVSNLGMPTNKMKEFKKIDEVVDNNQYYIRMLLPNIAGSIASVTKSMAEYNISLSAINQRNNGKNNTNDYASVSIITDITTSASVNKVLDQIAKNGQVKGIPTIIKIQQT